MQTTQTKLLIYYYLSNSKSLEEYLEYGKLRYICPNCVQISWKLSSFF